MQNSPKSKADGNGRDEKNDVPNVLDLYSMAEKACIPVYWYPMASALESFAVQLPENAAAIALDPEKVQNQGDEKYKLAHELGHTLTGAFYGMDTPLDEKGRSEQRADRWAIEHLVPFGALEEAVVGGRTELNDLAEFFDLPQPFMKKAIEYYTGPKGYTLLKE